MLSLEWKLIAEWDSWFSNDKLYTYICQYSDSLKISINLLCSFRDFFFFSPVQFVIHFHNTVNKSARKLKVIYTQIKASNEN